MWLAFKSKELAIMLPVVLLCYEHWLGKRHWKRLIPFFAVSLLFGIQALATVGTHTGTEYALHFNVLAQMRSEERRVGKECRYRCATRNYKEKVYVLKRTK